MRPLFGRFFCLMIRRENARRNTMKHFGRATLLMLGLGLFAFVLSSFPSHPAAAMGSAPVTVVNTSPIAVSLSGTSTISGSVNANITNSSPIPVSGTVNANIDPGASISVANRPTNAIPVVQAPIGTNIYNNTCSNTSEGSTGCVFPSIQTGMVLYVESASIQTYSTTGADPSLAGITEGLIAPPHFIPMIAQQPSSAGDSYVGQMVGAVHLPAGQPGCEVFLGVATGTVTITCTLFGYLVPAS
jgi:hypothetical protein